MAEKRPAAGSPRRSLPTIARETPLVRYDGRMQVTVELDEDVAAALQAAGGEGSEVVREAVNAALRDCLRARRPAEARPPFELPVWPLGLKVDIECVWRAIEEAEGQSLK